MKLEFSRQFFENTHVQNFVEIRPMGAKLFHANSRREGATDRHDEANSHFSQFC